MNEILCIDRHAYRLMGSVRDYEPGAEQRLWAILESHALWVERDQAERDDNLKQIVTYGIVRQDEFILAYRRRADHGRPDLASTRSIGVGGHVDVADFKDLPIQQVVHGIRRELDEEIGPDWGGVRILGLISSDEGAGRHHIGVVFQAKMMTFSTPRFSDELVGAGFILPVDVQYDFLEPWSRILYDAMVMTPVQRKEAQKARELEIGLMFDGYLGRK